MTTTHYRLNGPITAAGEERLRRFIKSREKELEFIKEEIEEERSHISDCKNAIYNLEMVIPDAKKVLEFHKESLAALKGIQDRMGGIPSLVSWKLKEEDTSKSLCAELRSCVAMPASSDGVKIREHTEAIDMEMKNLQSKINQLEMELQGWKLSLQLSEDSLTRLDSSRQTVEMKIAESNTPLRAIWRTPTDVWAQVFRLVKDDEFADHMKENEHKSLRSIVYVLSHVCGSWRSIVFGEPSLWSLVYAPPVTAWRSDEYELLTSSIQNTNTQITLLTNAYQHFSGGYYFDKRHEKDDKTWASVVTPNEGFIFPDRKYTLYINTINDHPSAFERISMMPFKRPTSIIFSATRSLGYGGFFSNVPCTEVASFTVINDYPNQLDAITLADYMPRLTILRLNVKQLPANLSLTGWLPTTLEELYVRHEINDAFAILAEGIQLPKLRTLGITSASTPLIQRVSMPMLKKLILYGTSDPTQEFRIGTSIIADQNYRRLSELRLDGWRKNLEGSSTTGVAAMLAATVPKTPALHSINIYDSFIDGEAFIQTITRATQKEDVVGLKYLEDITLSGVQGITRNECDQIKTMVRRLNVYV